MVKSKQRKYNILNFAIFIALSLYIARSMEDYTDISIRLGIMSFSMMCYHIVVLMRLKYDIVSSQVLFIFFSNVFIFSFFWLDSIGKDEFIFFQNWIDVDIKQKYQAALFCQICIHSLFTGMVFKQSPNKKSIIGGMQLSNVDLFRIGITFFFIGLPFKLYYDYLNILNSNITGFYQGYSGTVGITDDFQHFSIAGIIIIISSKKLSRNTNLLIAFSFLIYCLMVMVSSGDRRYYITAIIGVFMSLYYSSRKSSFQMSPKRFFYGVLSFIGVTAILNLMAIIRNNRVVSVGMNMLSGNNIDLFSLDGFFESLGEFGITLNAVLLCIDTIPNKIPFQYGLSYLYAIIYILPIGWLVSIPNASIGHSVTKLAGIPVGSSYLLDLYANFGWFSPVFAFLLGICFSKIIISKRDPVSIAINCFLTYILINYVRASTVEILRPAVYLLFLFWILGKYHMKSFKKR